MIKNPRYPIYIPTKGRFGNCLTAKMLVKDDVPFRLVVEEKEREEYASRFGEQRIIVLPFSNQGAVAARNWIKSHSIGEKQEWHWQLDDNIRTVRRYYKGERLVCRSGIGLSVIEDFVDRYENIAIAGMDYTMMVVHPRAPFTLNCRVYSCSLFRNSLPHQWRGPYNSDTDICLQVLSDGWCTVLFQAFLIEKVQTMLMKGGNTDSYQEDGRLEMARLLERRWPGVVTVKRRFNRPQHVIAASWKRFDTPLKRKQGVDVVDKTDEYGMKLNTLKPVKSKTLQKFLEKNRGLNHE